MNRTLLTLALAVAMPLVCSAGYAADPVADFYKGKNVFLQIGSGPGGTYDVTGRLFARHIGKYIPGSPTVVVQNVPGGGSLALANQFGNTTPRDGLYFGVFNNGMPTTPLLDPKAAHFDARKFNFMGSLSREAHLFGVWHTSPIRTIDDVYKQEVVVAGSAPGAAPYDFPRLTNALDGTKFKIVTGYQDEGDRRLAMQRGEVDGQAGSSWTTVRTSYKEMIAKKEFIVIAAFGMQKNRELQDVPLFPLGKSAEDKQLFQLMYARQSFGKPFATPPDVPAERVAALRKAFEDTMKDPDFVAEVKKLDLEYDPVPAKELTDLTAELYNTPKEVLDRMQKTLAPDSK
jgi:tripartite-type tricarboxylate transporter receptor subunit TctC